MEDNSKVVSSESESNSGSMQDILQLSNRSTRNMNFKPSYRIRKLKNKGALLILVWNCLATGTFHYLIGYPNMFHPTSHIYACSIILWGLTLPIAGWLADVCLTRYKVMRWSILIMWIASVLVTASSVLSQIPAIKRYYHDSANKYITMLLLIVMCLSFGGYQANAVLFGIDQLQDASTDEITSFITWYVSTYFSSGLVIKFIYICLGEAYNSLLPEFLVCICLTIMAVLTLLCDRIFLKEPITKNPFQLIYKVIKYAIKTKHPRCRSAFTYCEDNLPSRIDFGKHKYGGPFTTEEVEDVKTFLRLLVCIFIAAAMACGTLSLYNLEYQLIITHEDDSSHDALFHFDRFHDSSWITLITIEMTFYFSGTVLILLYEFIFYPLLRNHVPYMQNYQWKMAAGMFSQIAKIITLMTIDLTAHHSYIEHNNATIQCIFMEQSGILNSNFNMRWMILAQLFNSISVITSVIGAFEFICSQSPYSMRGLLFGATYCCVMLYFLVGYGIMKPFTKLSTSISWGRETISCEFWYLLLISVILILNSIMVCILSKWYKNRKREDVLPNEQVFAERYYTY